MLRFIALILLSMPFINASEAAENLSKQLSFSTERANFRPLTKNDFLKATELDASDESFVQVMDDVTAETLETQENFFMNSFDLTDLANQSKLYFAACQKESDKLLGVIKICNFNGTFGYHYQYLCTDAKYHKDCQGNGYATEVKKALLEHFQKLHITPSTESDKQPSLYLGFQGLIYLRNKPSLKYNILKSGYKIGRLFGDRVEIFYPFVRKCREKDPADETLHDIVIDYFGDYLSKDPAKADPALREICKISLNNLLTDGNSLQENLEGEDVFIASTLSDFPEHFDSLSSEQLKAITKCVNNIVPSMLAVRIKITVQKYLWCTGIRLIPAIKEYKQIAEVNSFLGVIKNAKKNLNNPLHQFPK